MRIGTILSVKNREVAERRTPQGGSLPGSIFTPQTSAFHTLVTIEWAPKLVTVVDLNFDWLHVGLETHEVTSGGL